MSKVDIISDSLILMIPGNMDLVEKHDDTWYECELIVAKRIGIDLNNYDFVNWIPGLRVRGGNTSSIQYNTENVDGYELHIEKCLGYEELTNTKNDYKGEDTEEE